MDLEIKLFFSHKSGLTPKFSLYYYYKGKLYEEEDKHF